MRYGCTEDFGSVRDNLLQSILWFEGDVAEVGSPENRRHSEEIGKLIKPYWMKNTEAGLQSRSRIIPSSAAFRNRIDRAELCAAGGACNFYTVLHRLSTRYFVTIL